VPVIQSNTTQSKLPRITGTRPVIRAEWGEELEVHLAGDFVEAPSRLEDALFRNSVGIGTDGRLLPSANTPLITVMSSRA
jgi:hypothetical protein